MPSEALGLLECKGLVCLMEGSDAMLKSANVEMVGWDKAGSGGISPADDEVCGWCRRVWLARNGCV